MNKIEYALLSATDKSSRIAAYQYAINEYSGRVTAGVGPLNELTKPFALVALQAMAQAIEATLTENQKIIAKELRTAGTITAIQFPYDIKGNI